MVFLYIPFCHIRDVFTSQMFRAQACMSLYKHMGKKTELRIWCSLSAALAREHLNRPIIVSLHTVPINCVINVYARRGG